MKYTHILWDFNGTLLNDVETGIISANTLLKRRGMPLIESVERYHSVFTFPITDYYINLGFDFTKEPYSEIAIEWVKENQENIKKAPLCKGAKEALELFRNKDIPQIILSATQLEMLMGHISDLGITEYFDEILGLDNIHAESKVSLALDWAERNPNSIPLVIGDTIHDAEVARNIGCDCLLCASGHQSKDRLLAAEVPVFDNLGEIIEYLFVE